MDVTIEMNRDLTVLKRTRYTVIDLLSDIGGVQSILMSLLATLVGLWNYENFDSEIASKLFKIRKEDSDEMQNIVPSSCTNLKNLFLGTFLCCCRKLGCCRKSKKARLTEAAYEKLQ